jgi:hypothetical protein
MPRIHVSPHVLLITLFFTLHVSYMHEARYLPGEDLVLRQIYLFPHSSTSNLQRITQMDEKPPITIIATHYEDAPDPIPSSWVEPFEELLLFLKIVDSPGGSSTALQEFCFQHTHDLSELSHVFLRVDVDEVKYSIDLRTFRFPREHESRAWVVELEEYANGALSRFRVSFFTHRAIGILTRWSDEDLGLPQPIDRRRYPP